MAAGERGQGVRLRPGGVLLDAGGGLAVQRLGGHGPTLAHPHPVGLLADREQPPGELLVARGRVAEDHPAPDPGHRTAQQWEVELGALDQGGRLLGDQGLELRARGVHGPVGREHVVVDAPALLAGVAVGADDARGLQQRQALVLVGRVHGEGAHRQFVEPLHVGVVQQDQQRPRQAAHLHGRPAVPGPHGPQGRGRPALLAEGRVRRHDPGPQVEGPADERGQRVGGGEADGLGAPGPGGPRYGEGPGRGPGGGPGPGFGVGFGGGAGCGLGHASTTLPGLSRFFGSKRRLSPRCSSRLTGSSSRVSHSRLRVPMPCSPVLVPPRARPAAMMSS